MLRSIENEVLVIFYNSDLDEKGYLKGNPYLVTMEK